MWWSPFVPAIQPWLLINLIKSQPSFLFPTIKFPNKIIGMFPVPIAMFPNPKIIHSFVGLYFPNNLFIRLKLSRLSLLIFGFGFLLWKALVAFGEEWGLTGVGDLGGGVVAGAGLLGEGVGGVLYWTVLVYWAGFYRGVLLDYVWL